MKSYNRPSVEVTKFSMEDIIAASALESSAIEEQLQEGGYTLTSTIDGNAPQSYVGAFFVD